MRLLTRFAGVLALLFAAGQASATTVSFSLASTSGNTWNGSQAGTPVLDGNGVPIPGQQEFVGSHTASTWQLTWDLVGDIDPFVDGVFSIKNSTSAVQTYTFIVTLPISPAVTPSSLVGGSIGLTVTDANFDGVATVASVGATGIFTGTNDSTATLPLLASFSLTASGAGNSNATAVNAGLPGTLPGPAALSTISIVHTFTLTPGDSVGLTSFYVVNPVPEPGTLILVVGALVGLAVRRRLAA